MAVGLAGMSGCDEGLAIVAGPAASALAAAGCAVASWPLFIVLFAAIATANARTLRRGDSDADETFFSGGNAERLEDVNCGAIDALESSFVPPRASPFAVVENVPTGNWPFLVALGLASVELSV
ncbi:MAG: hypothetical protein ACLPY1_16265 [Terracidiphilus sp.]